MGSIIETISQRRSIRTFSDKKISDELKRNIIKKIDALTNPWGIKIRYHLIEDQSIGRSEKIGTYGIIKNASTYLTAVIKNEDKALEALGYEMEELILYLCEKGLGSCWLGGTFTRGRIKEKVQLGDDEILPVLIPIGFPEMNRSIPDKILRKLSKGDLRKDWSQLFFNNDFNTILTKDEAGIYSDILEMVRLAPSASNKQPWRIVKVGDSLHFYKKESSGYGKIFPYDIQNIDIGIAAAHLDLTAKEQGIIGGFDPLYLVPDIKRPDDMIYKFTWVFGGDVMNTKEIYLAGGCFWGAEKFFSLIKGVIHTEVGYANGQTSNPTYQDVCYKNTGHAETVKVVFDPEVVDLKHILDLFYEIIDPTSINKQGNDVGSQYRTGIYYTDKEDLDMINKSIADLQDSYDEKIAIEILPLDNYTKAEDYHQQYLDNNPGGYCHIGHEKFKKAME